LFSTKTVIKTQNQVLNAMLNVWYAVILHYLQTPPHTHFQ